LPFKPPVVCENTEVVAKTNANRIAIDLMFRLISKRN
jgi:hypothetical protein